MLDIISCYWHHANGPNPQRTYHGSIPVTMHGTEDGSRARRRQRWPYWRWWWSWMLRLIVMLSYWRRLALGFFSWKSVYPETVSLAVKVMSCWTGKEWSLLGCLARWVGMKRRARSGISMAGWEVTGRSEDEARRRRESTMRGERLGRFGCKIFAG